MPLLCVNNLSTVLIDAFTMKTLVLLGLCCAAVLAVPPPPVREEGVAADRCTADVCKAEDGCRCATSQSPLSDVKDAPQLISLTFDEAVTDDLYNNYWQPILFNRNNPDDTPIGATFFVPHEYTDYQRVNDLYNYGFEIAVHSITENNLQQYWRSASEEILEQEFGGQKKILTKFANIPEEDIIGVRTPQFQLAANYSIEAYMASGLVYDSSWPTLPDHPLFPYTLDYLSNQQCLLGSKCPNEAFKGFWVLPINDLHGADNKECNTVSQCNITGTADEIADWLTKEVDAIRTGTRVPLTLVVESQWFGKTENSLEGFNKFLDRLTENKDVFLVTQKQVFEWMKNPVGLADFKTEFPQRSAACNTYSCKLKSQSDGKDRYMNTCVPCPLNYPWLGNPEGN
ncbi:hypothetical protein NQ315_004737 [Exocentrus adspersus]|uniref:Chitin deacetylase n=1 Tax=Exocentrus adspersus TaxID=1586481 RepID=A0AAV8W2A3_9CUCU|nr:hypothetical protein NQ315_004737 [Exocentrus adspersus]